MRTFSLLILLIGFLSAKSQDAPNRIGELMIGSATIEKMKAYIYNGRVLEMSDRDAYWDKKIKKSSGPVDVSTGLFEITNHGNDTSSTYHELFPDAQDFRYFFIDQIQVEDYYLNNLLMFFYKDTLMRFQFDSDFKLSAIYSTKYKYYSKKKYTDKSPCVVNRRALNNERTYFSATDLKANVNALLSLEVEINSDCQSQGFMHLVAYRNDFIKRYNDAGLESVARNRAETKRKQKEQMERKLKAF